VDAAVDAGDDIDVVDPSADGGDDAKAALVADESPTQETATSSLCVQS